MNVPELLVKVGIPWEGEDDVPADVDWVTALIGLELEPVPREGDE